MNLSPNTEERFWGVLSHLSALAFGMGILLPILGWSEQRRKSKYASFQCLQALGYQSLGFTMWLLAYLLIVVIALTVVVILSFRAEQTGQSFDPMAGPTMTLIYITFFGFFGIYILLPLVAAIACALGRDFRYPLLGSRLARYIGYSQAENTERLIEDHEERWVAAMGHFSVIILLWGLIAPLAAWITEGKRVPFLKFQSIQTLVYQTLVTVLYLGGLLIYFIGFFAFIAATGLAGVATDGPPPGMLSFIIFIAFSLLAFAIFMLVPLLHILGQWAGYCVLKGENYYYPIVGRLVARWMARTPPINTRQEPEAMEAG